MCDHIIIRQARETADWLLEDVLRVPVRKALSLATAEDFDQAVGALANKLEGVAREHELEAVRDAVAALDVDWRETTAAQRRALIAQATQRARRHTRRVPAALKAPLGAAAHDVVEAIRRDVRRKLSIGVDFNAVDRRIIKHITTSPTMFVRDAYGRRHQHFSEVARRIVARGLEAGLGRDDIASDLEQAARGIITGRGRYYWDVVAGAFVGRGRSLAQLSAYAEAGLSRYVIEAVLDEHTTEVCRFLHGQTLSVDEGLRAFARAEAEPEGLRELAPWMRHSKGLLFVERGGDRLPVAEVTRSAMGRRDERGEFSRGRSPRELMSLGVSHPPFHALCRTQILAEV